MTIPTLTVAPLWAKVAYAIVVVVPVTNRTGIVGLVLTIAAWFAVRHGLAAMQRLQARNDDHAAQDIAAGTDHIRPEPKDDAS